ncbi:hypothetical protein BDV11DRAFT_159314 [Aspergillus similis]
MYRRKHASGQLEALPSARLLVPGPLLLQVWAYLRQIHLSHELGHDHAYKLKSLFVFLESRLRELRNCDSRPRAGTKGVSSQVGSYIAGTPIASSPRRSFGYLAQGH